MRRAFFLALTALCLVACGGGGSSDDAGGEPGVDAARSPDTGTEAPGPDGGSLDDAAVEVDTGGADALADGGAPDGGATDAGTTGPACAPAGPWEQVGPDFGTGVVNSAMAAAEFGDHVYVSVMTGSAGRLVRLPPGGSAWEDDGVGVISTSFGSVGERDTLLVFEGRLYYFQQGGPTDGPGAFVLDAPGGTWAAIPSGLPRGIAPRHGGAVVFGGRLYTTMYGLRVLRADRSGFDLVLASSATGVESLLSGEAPYFAATRSRMLAWGNMAARGIAWSSDTTTWTVYPEHDTIQYWQGGADGDTAAMRRGLGAVMTFDGGATWSGPTSVFDPDWAGAVDGCVYVTGGSHVTVFREGESMGTVYEDGLPAMYGAGRVFHLGSHVYVRVDRALWRAPL